MSTMGEKPDAAHPFLDPALHDITAQALTLNSIGATSTTPATGESSGAGGNPLNEFAQQVLGREDAENLLDFGRHGHSIGEEQSFGELLQAARRRDGGDADGDDAPSRTEQDEIDGQKRAQLAQALQSPYDVGVGGGVANEQNGDAMEQSDSDAAAAAAVAAGGIAQRLAKRKRAGGEGDGVDGEVEGEVDGEARVLAMQEVARIKKDSHKEVERRRRENINDGINEIAQLVPGGMEKQGKGTLLKRAAMFIGELAAKVGKADEETKLREHEKQELRIELSRVQARLAEEQAHSLRYETSWREAEDRAASSQFELQRVKAELEEAKKR